MIIRPETPADYDTILPLTYDAFLALDYPGRGPVNEHYLISLLRDSVSVIPELCFVAERDGEIVGHILYVKSGFKRPDGTEADTVTFGPLSVWRKYHKQGIGKALVTHTVEKARKMGFGAVLIMGIPEYYPKLGFKRASEYNLKIADNSTEPDVDGAFMAYELIPGYLNGGGVYHSWPPEYDQTESDTAGFETFHKSFMAKYFSNDK